MSATQQELGAPVRERRYVGSQEKFVADYFTQFDEVPSEAVCISETGVLHDRFGITISTEMLEWG